MNIIDVSIRRPIFITCLVLLMLTVGALSLKRMPVDLFPDVTFPVVTVTILYPGAGPEEVETLISRPVEDELSTLSGVKTLRSINKEGVSTTIAEFTLETDVKYAEQQVRDRVSSLRNKLPTDSKEPVIRRIDPADQPILILSVTGDLPEGKLFDVADDVVRPKLEQIGNVGLVEVVGGRKREIEVLLDRNRLKDHEVSATMVANRVAAAGQNIPAGKVDRGDKETVLRSLAEFRSLNDIQATIVNFAGNEVPVRVQDLGKVEDGLEDETARTFTNGKQGIFLYLYRQSGANTIAVADNVQNRLGVINQDLKRQPGAPAVTIARDGSKAIRDNVTDVKESIYIGIILTLIVVFMFLGNGRSTLITGIAIPNSLLGAFLLMGWAGFSMNIMSLLALSLAVGLLIDDAIVVRENIFRHIEHGESPLVAASRGAKEVQLAVIATTLTVIAVFGPIGFLNGIIGQFFKQFGLTVCFVMAISLFDALTMAPMLSAFFAGSTQAKTTGLWAATVGRFTRGFDRFQDGLVVVYERVLRFTLRHPIVVIGANIAIFVGSLLAAKLIPKTFLPPQDNGEFAITLQLPPGSSLDATQAVAFQADKILRTNREVDTSLLVVGNQDGESNVAEFFVRLVPTAQRLGVTTSALKDRYREQIKSLAWANPVVKDYDPIGAGERPFQVVVMGDDLSQLDSVSDGLFQMLKEHPALKDVETSFKPGKPEFQVVWDNARGDRLGVSSAAMGAELRTMVEGTVPAVFREHGREYDIRVRLLESQRDIRPVYDQIFIPNVNNSLVRLGNVSHPVTTSGPATIQRQDRGRSVTIGADVSASGGGMGAAMDAVDRYFVQHKLPAGMRYAFVGQAQSFQELISNMILAVVLAVLFIYLVLASLYESFITPFTIMLVLPLAICGALFALAITKESLDIFSMIGCVMLLGIATKNSILLVDYTNQKIREGMDRSEAIIEAGKVRLRPILMTSFALIAGMIPVAIGLNEASRQRTSMGVSIIGGLVTSTLLSLVVVPAAFSYIDSLRIWLGKLVGRLQVKGGKEIEPEVSPDAGDKKLAARL